MDEYIEREAAVKKVAANRTQFDTDSDAEYAEALLFNVPAADVVEVRHGEWIKGKEEHLYLNYDMSGFYDFSVTCSVCKFDLTEYGYAETNYCPNCGAKMDGKGEGE